MKTTPPIPDGKVYNFLFIRTNAVLFSITALGKDVADFISRLLVKDPRQRLGGGEGDAKELKRHPFFRTLDWNALAQKQIPAPFKPTIR